MGCGGRPNLVAENIVPLPKKNCSADSWKEINLGSKWHAELHNGEAFQQPD